VNLGVIIGNPAESFKSLSRTEDRMLELKMRFWISRRAHLSVCELLPAHSHLWDQRLPPFPQKKVGLGLRHRHESELYNFYTSILRGDDFSYDELTEIRKEMAARGMDMS